MPIYTYECKDCGEAIDVRNTVDERDTKAPLCGCGAIMKRPFITSRVWAPTRSQ